MLHVGRGIWSGNQLFLRASFFRIDFCLGLERLTLWGVRDPGASAVELPQLVRVHLGVELLMRNARFGLTGIVGKVGNLPAPAGHSHSPQPLGLVVAKPLAFAAEVLHCST